MYTPIFYEIVILFSLGLLFAFFCCCFFDRAQCGKLHRGGLERIQIFFFCVGFDHAPSFFCRCSKSGWNSGPVSKIFFRLCVSKKAPPNTHHTQLQTQSIYISPPSQRPSIVPLLSFYYLPLWCAYATVLLLVFYPMVSSGLSFARCFERFGFDCFVSPFQKLKLFKNLKMFVFQKINATRDDEVERSIFFQPPQSSRPLVFLSQSDHKSEPGDLTAIQFSYLQMIYIIPTQTKLIQYSDSFVQCLLFARTLKPSVKIKEEENHRIKLIRQLFLFAENLNRDYFHLASSIHCLLEQILSREVGIHKGFD